ncbi:ankyrin repeat domain-containing protein [Candidatus Berkiella aquae]|uniref:Ankyrin repeat domain-containing protein n=1 Tax=Candidatus Berkiella aquae TaxID=295108 RepID=A0A0Q9YSM0_9GAMM|nr:ankyrin repeat domain-containing protein [Candidatus Berkiella aquae]MCS5710705.1 ankyrin repeat domain-containing protein [Candidatus Berkiella aquae]
MVTEVDIEQLKEILPEDLFTKIFPGGNLNVVDPTGKTAVHYLAFKGEQHLLEKIVAEGADVNKAANNGNTPLHYACQTGAISLIQYLLKNMNNPSATNSEGQTALQVALEYDATISAIILLKHPEFKEHLEDKDIYGRSALDIIAEYQLEDLFPSLNVDFAERPNYGKPLVDVSQSVINEKLRNYLSLHGRMSDELIDDNGACNGWSFLYQLYEDTGQEEIFYQLLEFIESWDGEIESLQKMEIPAPLKEKYRNAQEIFEQTINDLIVFHHDSIAVNELDLGYKQKWRQKQYELVKGKNDTRQLNSLLYFPMHYLNQKQLIEMFHYFSQKPGSFVDLGGAGHSVSVTVMPNEKFKYFDSNARGKIQVFNSAEELVKTIVNLKFRELNMIQPDGTFEVRMGVYQFSDKITLDEKSGFTPPPLHNSAMLFSPLHYAVLNKDQKQLNINLIENRKGINQNDAMGFSALTWAGCLNDVESIRYLVESGADINHADNFGETPLIQAIRCNHIEAVKKLIALGADINQKDNIGQTPLNHAAKNGCFEIVGLLSNLEGIKLDEPDNVGQTPLMNAVEKGYHRVVKKLIKKDINLEAEDNNKKTVFEHIDKASVKRMAPLLVKAVPNSKRTALFFNAVNNGDVDLINTLIKNGVSVDIKDGDGLTPLMYAAFYGNIEMTKALLAHTQEINAFVEVDGTTALIAAASAGKLEVVKLLLKAGADISLVNKQGKTAQEIAQDEGHDEIVTLLRSSKRPDHNIIPF